MRYFGGRKVGAIIRSVGERTAKLCEKSLEEGLPSNCIRVVENVSPFLQTLGECYRIAISEKFDWYLLVDADMIMVKDWRKILAITLEKMDAVNRLWEFTFRLKDSIENRNIDALHVVRGKYSEELLMSTSLVKDGLKPEGRVRDNMMKRTGTKRIITKEVLAYHGYEQYARDIFNRFYNRACRDPKYADRFKLFRSLDTEDKKIAQAGWSYGLRNSNLASLDSRNKLLDVMQFGFKEKSHIRFKLDRFYKKVG